LPNVDVAQVKMFREYTSAILSRNSCIGNCEEDADTSEAEYRQILAKLEADWPERVECCSLGTTGQG
jgi:hypothetical protein